MTDNTDADDRNDELGNDVAASLNALFKEIEFPDEAGPMGMNPGQLANMFQMKMVEWAAENEDSAVETFAVIHVATNDLIEKHADRPATEIAGEKFG